MAPATVDINLAKALKLKNRLVGRVAKLDADIQRHNSVQEGMEQADVPALFEERKRVVEYLIDLKTKINRANAPVQDVIYRLAEHKAVIGLLNRLDTTHGKKVEGYSGAEVNYVAHFRKGFVDREVRRLEREIDDLQDRLDTFNHQNLIPIDAGMLADAEPAPEG